MLKNGPILALNLLKVDESVDGPDQVNYTALSLDSCKANPRVVNAGKKYGEYDYQGNTMDKLLYGTSEGDVIPYVGKTPFASLFDRSRFWIPSKNNLLEVAANGLQTNDSGTYEHTNLLNFANTGTDEISILVYKPEGLAGYDVTAKEWWGGEENIPYGWIRPSDYISDYFIRVVAVKGNWTNYPVLSNDPIWSKYFDKNGIIKDRVSLFCGAEGITFINSWTGIIIPDFIDKQGNYLYIESKVNADTEKTGLLMSINEDALQVISYDKNGVDVESGEQTGVGSWVYDFDGNAQAESELGEGAIDSTGYLVDMVGHNLQNGIYRSDVYVNLKHPYAESAPTDPTEADLAAVCPTYYFLKTNGTADTNAICMSFNGRDTSTNTTDDVQPTATIRVLSKTSLTANFVVTDAEGNPVKDSSGNVSTTQSTKEGWAKAYVVYNKATNRAIRGNGKQDAQSYYVCIPDGADVTLLPTEEIKKLPVYAQANKNVSYNTKDEITGKTVTAVLGGGETSVDLILKEVPVVKDTNDTYIYKDVNVFYGTYGIADYDKLTVSLYSVTGGAKYGSYAEVADLDTITTNTLNNVLKPVNSQTGITIQKNATTFDTVKENCYTFYYGGSEYAIMKVGSTTEIFKKVLSDTPDYFGVNFMSYNYLTENVNEAITDVYQIMYFNGFKNDSEINETITLTDSGLYSTSQEVPVTENNLNTFICYNVVQAAEISVGDFVNNITYFNNTGEAEKYNLIPGVTRVIEKVFINVDARNEFTYKGKKYTVNPGVLSQLIETNTGKRGFYLFTALDPVYVSKTGYITRQLPLSDDTISHSLKFIPLKGLHISAKHRPGFDEYGKVNIEAGIEKIYSMLEDDGIHRGLTNPNMVNYRYIVDSMSYGLGEEMGGKVYLSRLALDRGKCTALLNLPSKRQFELSNNPCFCDTYVQGAYSKPPFDTKYIPLGGNADLYNTVTFTLPKEDDGSKFSAAFWPHLTYNVNGRKINVPPAADVCNVLIRKFQGGDPYVIAANRNGIIRNDDVTGVEFMADVKDREYLEPYGVNTIIQDGNEVFIYANQTCYQNTKSDFNKLHVRENLNTLEIACEDVLKQYNFLYNTPAVRASIVTALTPILETMKLSGAIEKYEITCDESNNTPEIIQQYFGVVDLAIWCNMGMERIVQRIQLNRRDTLTD